jgi:type IV fimbrial biogenesis protein FimT
MDRGFTLTELLAVISIAAVLMAIGAPSYRSITTSSRVSTEINALLVDLQFARSEALKEGLPATACISSDGATCTGGSHWQDGWIVFSDANGDATVDGSDVVLRVQRPLSAADTLQANTGLAAIAFNREGFALNLPAAGVLMTLHDATSNSTFTRCLSVTMAGMLATQTHAAAPSSCT